MQYYSDMILTGDLKILIGIENDKIIFSHSFRTVKQKEKLIKLEKQYFPSLKEDKSKLKDIMNKIEKYKKGERVNPSGFETKFSRGTEFEKKVWKTLKKTNRGDIISYKKLASLAGYTGANRAVGTVMSKNYLLLFVPCHRVLRSNGSLGGFGCGLDIKEFLLDTEQK